MSNIYLLFSSMIDILKTDLGGISFFWAFIFFIVILTVWRLF